MKNRKSHTTRPRLTPAQKEAIYALPLCKQFRIVHIDEASGLAVFQHVLVDETAHDYPQVLAVAKAYARETPCAINPIVNKGAPEGRRRIYPGIEDSNANPDLTTEKYGYVDVKSPFSKNNITQNANKACKQMAIAMITDLSMDEAITEAEVFKFSERIFSKKNTNNCKRFNYKQDQIHWFVNGILYKCNRPEKELIPFRPEVALLLGQLSTVIYPSVTQRYKKLPNPQGTTPKIKPGTAPVNIR